MTQIRQLIDLLEAKSEPKLERIALRYGLGDLTPVMSKSLMQLHYGKLYKGYVDRYNNNENKEFNKAGAYLHSLFFSQFKTPGLIKPHGRILDIIETHHSNFIKFKEHFKEEALEIRGSGWVYLSKSGSIKTIQNHAMRTDIAIIVDMWEHSFQNDYGSNKAKYLDSIWRIMDWTAINRRLSSNQ